MRELAINIVVDSFIKKIRKSKMLRFVDIDYE